MDAMPNLARGRVDRDGAARTRPQAVEEARSGGAARFLLVRQGDVAVESDEVLVLTRLMILDDKPWMIDRATYSAKRYPGFLEQIEDGVSTYNVMREQYGVRMRRAYREITLAYATNEQAKMLGCAPSAPLFKTFKVVYDEQGLPVHMSSTYTQADNVVLTVENGNYRKELIEKQSG